MPARSASTKRPVGNYIPLGLLFLAAVAYAAGATEYHFPNWFHRANAAGWPFLVFPQYRGPGFSIKYLRPQAIQVGLRDGDTIVAINGRPVTGIAVFGEAIAKSHRGEALRMTVRSPEGPGESPEKTVAVTLNPASQAGLGVGLVLFVFMPGLCLLLGFWVAAVRPRDPLAWLLLALMLSFTAFFKPGDEFWGPWARDLGAVYQVGLSSTWAIWMFLLGIYFPEPFPAESGRKRWRWLPWVIVLPLSLHAVAKVIISVGAMENYASVFSLQRLVARVEWFATAFGYAATIGFLACIAAKCRLAVSRDAKRRLRLLSAGAVISLMPATILFTIAYLKHVAMEEYFPGWLYVTSYLMMSLFPVTLAYVIVVHRAIDVRVVIRQGLKYAFAKSGIWVLRIGLGVVCWYALASLASRSGGHLLIYAVRDKLPPSTERLLFYGIVALGVGIALGLRKFFKLLLAWTDRRFFRDAYNAEQILSELAEKVRTLVDTPRLLQTVAQRITESLHVPHIAVLVDGSGPYRPAFALGYAAVPAVVFPEDAGTVRHLRNAREPARVYIDDPNSWIYRSPAVTDEERKNLEELRAELLLPLSVKDKLLGFISLGQKRSEEPYSGTDLRLLKSVAAQTGLALENARLTSAIAEEIAQREKLNRELEIAREVQERLFPQRLPAVPGLDYFGACRPALGVGGDYYDFLALPGEKLGIAIGDVSGKGIAAALMMASLQASLRGEATRATDDLAGLMRNVNRLIYEASSVNRYATFFYAQYEAATRRLTYVNAGHNPPMLFSKSNGTWQVMRLDVGGLVVGLLPNAPYQQATMTLARGDILVAFTDGISEAMNPADEEWGEDGLMKTVKTCEGLSAADMIEQIMSAADAFAASAKQHDDMTLVILRVISEPDGSDLPARQSSNRHLKQFIG